MAVATPLFARCPWASQYFSFSRLLVLIAGREKGFTLGSFWQDVRFGIRMLVRTPVYTVAAVTVLALGLGANTATFSVINAVLLRPLPFEKSEELVSVSAFIPQLNDDVATGNEYHALADNAVSYEAVSAYTYLSRVLTQVDRPKRIVAGMVTASFFPMLGIQPLAGRILHCSGRPWRPSCSGHGDRIPVLATVLRG